MHQSKTACSSAKMCIRRGMLPMKSPIHAMRQPPSATTPRCGGAAINDGAADAAARDWPADDGVLSDVWSVFQQLMLEVPNRNQFHILPSP